MVKIYNIASFLQSRRSVYIIYMYISYLRQSKNDYKCMGNRLNFKKSVYDKVTVKRTNEIQEVRAFLDKINTQ